MSGENVATLRAFIETWSPEWSLEAWERGEVMDMSFVDPDVIYEEAARSSISAHLRTPTRPSKPPGCGSRPAAISTRSARPGAASATW